MKILKIGGSLITDKSQGAFEIAKLNEIDKIAKQIFGEVIIVHGVGSFGHPHVKKFGLTRNGIVKTHLACLKLNMIFCSKLENYGLSPIPIHPLEFFSNLDFDFIKKLLKNGFIPVFHGDVIYDHKGFRVMSGDEIVRILAEELNPERVGFASDTAIQIDGKIVREINSSNFNEIIKYVSLAENKEDITGGMRGKLIEAYRIASVCDVFIFNGKKEYEIYRFLKGEEIATKITKRF